MRQANKKILFISHNASRSGAPMVLLYLLKWLKKNTTLKFDVLVLYDGALLPDFKALTDTYVATEIFNELDILNRLKRKRIPQGDWETYKMRYIIGKLPVNEYGLIYGNTVLSLPWLDALKEIYKIKTVCAIHELSYVMERFFAKDYLEKQLANLDHIFAGSEAVAQNITLNLQIPTSKVSIAHAFIEPGVKPTQPASAMRKRLGIPDGVFVIGGAGTPEWRKGTDLIVLLVKQLKKKYVDLPFKLIWVGGNNNDLPIVESKYDLAKCGLQDDVIFVSATKEYLDYINAFDVFVLLSREDPFPLVNLEASFLEKLIVAFDKSGGAQELLTNGGGVLVPYLDIDAMADTLWRVYNDEAFRKEAGRKGKAVVEDKFCPDIIVSRMVSELDPFLN